ncbi:MAG: hypothetical protein AABM30_07015 [Actinomycetota bacterium]
MPPAQYARRADELCRREIVRLTDLRVRQRLHKIQVSAGTEEEKLARAAPVLAEQLRVISEFRRDFELLGWPSAHRDDAEALISKTSSAEKELQRVIDAGRSGDAAKAGDALRRYYGFATQSASIARDSKLNFAICGSGA